MASDSERLLAEFNIRVRIHTEDGLRVITDPEMLRHVLGATLDRRYLQEEIDYTLEVTRVHSYDGRPSAKPTLLSAEDLEQELTAVEVIHAAPAQRLRQHIAALIAEWDEQLRREDEYDQAVEDANISRQAAERTITHLRDEVIKPLVETSQHLLGHTKNKGSACKLLAMGKFIAALATARAEMEK